MKKQRVQNKLIEELERTPIVQIACDKVDISRNTFYRWMKEDMNFLERVNESLSLGTGLVNDVALSNVLSGIKSKDVKYTMYWLNRKHPDFRQPFVHKVDSDDLLTHHRLLKEGAKKLQIEEDIRETITEQRRKSMEEAEKGAKEFMEKWRGVNNKAIENKAIDLFEKWKKEEENKKNNPANPKN